MTALRPSGALNPLLARMQSAYRLCKSAYRGGAEVVGARSEWRRGPEQRRTWSWPAKLANH
jgi:hypothetical protein